MGREGSPGHVSASVFVEWQGIHISVCSDRGPGLTSKVAWILTGSTVGSRSFACFREKSTTQVCYVQTPEENWRTSDVTARRSKFRQRMALGFRSAIVLVRVHHADDDLNPSVEFRRCRYHINSRKKETKVAPWLTNQPCKGSKPRQNARAHYLS